jgi:phosphoribosylformylglycinamidine synthase
LVRVEVRISLKRGVLDAEGASTMRAMEILGFKDVRKVNVAKTFVLEFEGAESAARSRAEEVCKVLLANPVIHDYRIDVLTKE